MTKPIITRPGKYITRDGRTVGVIRRTDAGPWRRTHPWNTNEPGMSAGDSIGNDGLVSGEGNEYPWDIIAAAPSPRQANPRPVASKPTKRRYVALRCQDNHVTRYTVDRMVDDDISVTVAYMDSRADARAFAAMKNAQRGGK